MFPGRQWIWFSNKLSSDLNYCNYFIRNCLIRNKRLVYELKQCINQIIFCFMIFLIFKKKNCIYCSIMQKLDPSMANRIVYTCLITRPLWLKLCNTTVLYKYLRLLIFSLSGFLGTWNHYGFNSAFGHSLFTIIFWCCKDKGPGKYLSTSIQQQQQSKTWSKPTN